MPELYYRDALKLGQREYRACASSGNYPYLSVLDDFVPSERSASGMNLGLASIPAEFIVGTKTRGRTNAFARNFMPLLAEGTEFAQKWERLCQSHLQEGIRDPIKVYEYLNRYYVEEGNKRVSVLKFFGAVSIHAEVIRVMPEAGTDEAELYREYLAFCRVTGINFLEVSRKGGYALLLEKLGIAGETSWTEKDRARFSMLYYAVKELYDGMGGDRLSATVGDALLACLEVYGYEALCGYDRAGLKKALSKVWEEIRLQQEAAPVELKPAPADGKRTGLLTRVLNQSKTVRVSFFYDRDPDNSAWAYGHEQGRLSVQKAFEGRIETEAVCNVMEGDARAMLEKAVVNGNKVIFTTSPRLLQVSLQVAVEHPEVTILNCSLNQSHRYIRTYYPRVHEAKFILGAIAGAMTEKGDVGYICDYPIYGQVAGINAFAMGVQLVNPRAKVALEWSSVIGREAAKQRLAERGVKLISSQDMSRRTGDDFVGYGLIPLGDGAPKPLAAPLWRWDVYYQEMLRRILDNTLRDEYESSTRAVNYYWGMSAGVIDAWWSPELPAGVRKLAELLRQGIVRGECSPFALPLRKQSGEPVGEEGGELSLEEIVGMDYLVASVDGEIPAYVEIQDVSRATVDVMGVDPTVRDRKR